MSRFDWYKPGRKSRNRRLKCECDGWWFPHRVGSRSLNPATPGCQRKKAKW